MTSRIYWLIFDKNTSIWHCFYTFCKTYCFWTINLFNLSRHLFFFIFQFQAFAMRIPLFTNKILRVNAIDSVLFLINFILLPLSIWMKIYFGHWTNVNRFDFLCHNGVRSLNLSDRQLFLILDWKMCINRWVDQKKMFARYIRIYIH